MGLVENFPPPLGCVPFSDWLKYGVTDFILNPLPSNLNQYSQTEREAPRGPAATGPHGWSPIHPQDEYTPVFYRYLYCLSRYLCCLSRYLCCLSRYLCCLSRYLCCYTCHIWPGYLLVYYKPLLECFCAVTTTRLLVRLTFPFADVLTSLKIKRVHIY